MNNLKKKERSYSRIEGCVPAESKCYVFIMFDISDIKKYNAITKVFKHYGYRIQNSVYEGYIKPGDYRNLITDIEKIMGGKHFFNPEDRVRVYRITGSCSAVIYGPCSDEYDLLEENVFL